MQNGSRLDKALAKYVIVLDTCFAMQESFDAFLQNYKPVLQRNHVLVPYRVVQELSRILDLRDDRQHVAEFTLLLLETATKEGTAEYRRDPEDDRVINDAVISRVVEGLLPRRDVLVLTHDSNLSSYLYTKTQQQSFRVKDLIVAGVNSEGELFAWGEHRQASNGRRDEGARMRRDPRRRVRSASGGPAPFALTNKLASSLGTPLSSRQAVREGDALFLKDGSRVTLRRVLATGGEGTIYELDDESSLCKVYRQDKLTLDRQEKIELMLTRTVSDPMICWPRAAVYDSDKVFRGFIMPRALGKPVPLGHSLFLPAAFLKARPSWTRLNSARLAMTILQKIKRLHDMNVLIGDINPQNILMEDEKTIYLVDCDSYQIEGYPCSVGTVNFTAPEIQGSDFRHFLRTKEHELFSVATLLFMIFMPGKSPYSHQGGEDGVTNIRKMHFPYALGERRPVAAPAGPWRLCWSHLPFTMKEAFNQCFHEDHRNEKRVSIDRWALLLQEYLQVLEKRSMVFHGPARQVGYDLSILPENYRRVEKDGEIRPQWPIDTSTDRERMVRQLVADANSAAYANHAGSDSANTAGSSYAGTTLTTQTRSVSARASGWTTGTSTPATATTHTSPPFSTGIASTGKKGSSADWKWIIGFLLTIAVSGIVGLVWYFWDPIVEFFTTLFAIAFWAAIICGALLLFSKK